MVLVSAGRHSSPMDVRCNGLLFLSCSRLSIVGIGDSYLESVVVIRIISHRVDIWGSYCYSSVVADTSV